MYMVHRSYLLRSLWALILVLMSNPGFTIGPVNEAWRLRFERNGVRVWTQPVPGYQEEAYKAQADMNLPINEIFPFLSDVEGFVDWVSGVNEVVILERSELSTLYYINISTPLAQDRDYVGRITVVPPGTDGWASVAHESVPGIVPPNPGTIRVADYYETWKLVKLDANRTAVSMEAFFDPGGQLPALVVNWFITDAPYGVFETMRKRIGTSNTR